MPKTFLIQHLETHGEGVAFDEGKQVFIPGALPGESVIAESVTEKKNYKTAKLLQILTPSPDRITPPCPVFGLCGGCQLQHVAYAAQLELKRKRVVDALGKNVFVAPTLPSPKPFGYRNKMLLPVDKNHVIGLYAIRSHDVINIGTCLVHCPLGEKVFQKIKELLGPVTENLRHVLIKSAVHEGECLVVFVTDGAPTEGLRQAAKKLQKICPEVKGVLANCNTSKENVILSNRWQTLSGQEAIYETIAGLKFKVSPASFFQVNPFQAQTLYTEALAFADIQPGERVLDAYCGVGSLTLQIARKAKEVVGIEYVPKSIEDAKENGVNNAIENILWIAAAVEDALAAGIGPIDKAILNPPRKGCESTALAALGSYAPKRIVYLSCSPATLARDAAVLQDFGYTLQKAQPIDMFPQTTHVETVALFKRQSTPE